MYVMHVIYVMYVMHVMCVTYVTHVMYVMYVMCVMYVMYVMSVTRVMYVTYVMHATCPRNARMRPPASRRRRGRAARAGCRPPTAGPGGVVLVLNRMV